MTSGEELAAIAAALQITHEDDRSPGVPASGWTISMRQPDLSIDDVRSAVRRAARKG